MKTLRLLLLALTAFFAGINGTSAENSAPERALADYIAKPDSSYAYTVKNISSTKNGTTYAEIIMTSQTWHEPWKHLLYIIMPSSIRPGTSHALLFIGGGRWDDSYKNETSNAKFTDKLWFYEILANKIGTPVAVLNQVPYQPIWGLKENALIAKTFAEYLETGDTQRPVLLPMVKSAVRAMDTVQDFTEKKWSLSVKTFTVTGASKRGWTAWLTAAVDKRVTALAPMVIDILNMGRQMRRQQEILGEGNYSENISAFTDLGIHHYTETSIGKSLISIVDPYSYRSELNQPKLIVLGTNDRYWTLDALNYYWNGLTGPKYILYVPNRGHKLNEYMKIMGSINALHQHAAFGARLPDLTWKSTRTGEKLSYTLNSDIEPYAVRAWYAESSIKDFRGAVWNSSNLKLKKDGYSFKIKAPQDKCIAVFLEAEYASAMNYYFTTNVRIIGPEKCNAVS